jgi:hypothetical protein
MGIKGFALLALIVTALIAVGATGCGGSSSDGTNGTDGTNGGSTSSGEAGSSKPAAEFMKKGANNELAEFGKEASEEEREAASVVLEENLAARASGDYATQCETLSAQSVKLVEESGGPLGKETCAQTLGKQAEKAQPAVLENTMIEPVAALRVQGKQAYALYHGKGGKNYAMSMEKEPNGEWKVGSLTTQELP